MYAQESDVPTGLSLLDSLRLCAAARSQVWLVLVEVEVVAEEGKLELRVEVVEDRDPSLWWRC